MRRASLLVAIIWLGAVCATCALAAEVTIGPSPSWYRPLPIPLQDKAAAPLAKEPQYVGTPLYGVVTLGDGPNRDFTVVVDVAPDWSKFGEAFKAANGKVEMSTVPAHIYVDANQDKDLTNDGAGAVTGCFPDRGAKDGYTILGAAKCKVAYADGQTLEYPLGFWMFPQRGKIKQGNAEQDYGRTLYYRRDCSFETKLDVAGQQVLARFYDENANGLIAAQDGDLLAIDLNQDGQIDAMMRGPEVYKLDAPFNLGGESYVLKSAGPRGNSAVVAVSEQKVPAPVYVAVGQPAPDFTMGTLDGGTFKLAEQRGKVVLLDFWATWCGPCRQELPNVVKMWNEVQDKGLVLVGISLDRDDAQAKAVDTVRKFAPENGMTWTHIVEGKYWDSAIAKLYLVEGIPHTVLIGRDGKIVAVDLRGEALAAKVKELLGG